MSHVVSRLLVGPISAIALILSWFFFGSTDTSLPTTAHVAIGSGTIIRNHRPLPRSLPAPPATADGLAFVDDAPDIIPDPNPEVRALTPEELAACAGGPLPDFNEPRWRRLCDGIVQQTASATERDALCTRILEKAWALSDGRISPEFERPDYCPGD